MNPLLDESLPSPVSVMGVDFFFTLYLSAGIVNDEGGDFVLTNAVEVASTNLCQESIGGNGVLFFATAFYRLPVHPQSKFLFSTVAFVGVLYFLRAGLVKLSVVALTIVQRTRPSNVNCGTLRWVMHARTHARVALCTRRNILLHARSYIAEIIFLLLFTDRHWPVRS